MNNVDGKFAVMSAFNKLDVKWTFAFGKLYPREPRPIERRAENPAVHENWGAPLAAPAPHNNNPPAPHLYPY